MHFHDRIKQLFDFVENMISNNKINNNELNPRL